MTYVLPFQPEFTSLLNLYKLEVFEVVIQAGSFSAAAERLLLTQPAVSQHIGDLEAALGTALFTRSRRGVEPTEAGAALHEYTRQIFELVARAEEAVMDVRALSSGQVRLGASPGVGIYLLPDWVQQFRAHHPRLSVTLRTGTTPTIAAELRRGQLDLAFLEGELEAADADLRTLPLRDEEQLVVVGRKHPWWERTGVAVGELGTQTFIVRQRHSQSRIWLEAELDRHGIQPAIGAEFDALESIKRAVSLGTCLAVLPPYVVADEVDAGMLRALPVSDSPFSRTLRLAWNAAMPWSPVTRAFLRSLLPHLPALAAVVTA